MVVADAGYKTPAIAHQLLEDGIQPLFPYTRPKTKEGFSGNTNSHMMNTMIVIYVREHIYCHTVQQTEVDIKSIKAAVNIVLDANIFQNAQKVRIM